MFGFSPIGRTCEMVVCRNEIDVTNEFGFPESAPEKYFIDSAIRVINEGGTALMTRLPYDNDQSNTVKYVEYGIEDPIAMSDIATIPAESKVRMDNDDAVTVLKEMNRLDRRMT